ncbi:hypothetical protein PEBR_15726 [Penicillium brasilianum]|uniref:Cell cycle control protein cwf14 n=1 Tax=Penicillium brasilianum TaxID=104259 RepID=A0A1S9RQ12_PENBI|nr:hypothetical protein PEBR_15726 [Penicillium brasilianum]
MPPIRTARNRKPPPAGFDDLEDTLLEFSNKMKDAENAPHEGKKKHEVLWPIFQISHQRSRYIYDLYYEKEAISKQLYDWLLKNNYADANLIAKWKKQGYEKVSTQFPLLSKRTGHTHYILFILFVWPISAVPSQLTPLSSHLALLSALRPNQRNKLQLHLYLPRTQSPVERGADDSVRQLRLPRLCEQRLMRDG